MSETTTITVTNPLEFIPNECARNAIMVARESLLAVIRRNDRIILGEIDLSDDALKTTVRDLNLLCGFNSEEDLSVVDAPKYYVTGNGFRREDIDLVLDELEEESGLDNVADYREIIAEKVMASRFWLKDLETYSIPTGNDLLHDEVSALWLEIVGD